MNSLSTVNTTGSDSKQERGSAQCSAAHPQIPKLVQKDAMIEDTEDCWVVKNSEDGRNTPTMPPPEANKHNQCNLSPITQPEP